LFTPFEQRLRTPVAGDGTGPLADAELHSARKNCAEEKKGGTTNRASSLLGWGFLCGKKEKRKRLFSSDRLKAHWRSGAFCRTARVT